MKKVYDEWFREYKDDLIEEFLEKYEIKFIKFCEEQFEICRFGKPGTEL